MKNLKISKKAKALIIAGATFVVGTIAYNQFQNEDGTYYGSLYNKTKLTYELLTSSEIPVTKVDDYREYLIDNNLVLFNDGKTEVEEKYSKNGNYYQKKITDGNGGHTWKLISKEEQKKFTGLLRKSDDIDYRIYGISYDESDFTKTRVYNIEDDKLYCLDLENPVQLVNSEEYYCYDGKITNKVR